MRSTESESLRISRFGRFSLTVSSQGSIFAPFTTNKSHEASFFISFGLGSQIWGSLSKGIKLLTLIVSPPIIFVRSFTG